MDSKRKWDGQVAQEILSKKEKKKEEYDYDMELLKMYQ